MKRGYTRRQFIRGAAAASAAGAVAGALPLQAIATAPPAPAPGALTPAQRRTLDAALARMIPAEGPDDWSAADLGAGDYVEALLAGSGALYPGGPTRDRFPQWQALPRAKEIGWADEIDRLRSLYASGLATLDTRAPGGDFAALAPEAQDAILTQLDLEGSAFFGALYEHTMEGVYAHPVYGGNRDYRAWDDLCYEGDVHGVRFPDQIDPGVEDGAWNVYGGYAPSEMLRPGACIRDQHR